VRHQGLDNNLLTPEELATWNLAFEVRNEVTRAIEPLRQSKTLGHSLDARITLYAQGKTYDQLASIAANLRDIFIVSQVELKSGPAPEQAMSSELPELHISVDKALGEKCLRCWIYDENLGTDPDHPQTCPRCTGVLKEYHG
jgi:isoleucyl-tRNA synthetase